MKRYEKVLKRLREGSFLAPDGKNIDILVNLVRLAVETVTAYQGSGPMYPFGSHRRSISQVALEAEIPQGHSKNQEVFIKNLFKEMQGSIKVNNPFMVKNIIPVPALIHLATNLAVSLYMPNGVTGEDAGETLNAEIACASSIAKLAGFNVNRAAGVFTFGGTGTNLYAHKIGLMKAAPAHGLEGLKDADIVVIGSRASHYSHQTVSNWLGIGQNNYLQVGSNIDQTTKIDELENKCRTVLNSGKKIACIEAVGGTTSNMAIDDIEEIYKIREKLVLEFKLTYKPHIHIDSVLGWAYLSFTDYNFKQNPLDFGKKTIRKIKKIVGKVKKFKFADSFGVDFHKTGYIPYVSSMIIVKEQSDFALLRRDKDIMTPLFHDDSAYNPGIFTLETSRSAANILATWTTLQALGREGYQVLLGHSIEISECIREEIEKYEGYGLYIANREHCGCDVFVRCYPPGVHPGRTYQRELRDDSVLKIYTDYNNGFAKWLFANNSQGDEGIALSKTSAAFYTHTGSPMVALRIYPLNPYITTKSSEALIKRLVKAKRDFDETNANSNLFIENYETKGRIH